MYSEGEGGRRGDRARERELQGKRARENLLGLLTISLLSSSNIYFSLAFYVRVRVHIGAFI